MLFGCITNRNRIAYYPFQNEESAFLNVILPETPKKNMYYKVYLKLEIPKNPKEEDSAYTFSFDFFGLEKSSHYILNPSIYYWKREYNLTLKSNYEFLSGTYKIPVPTGKNKYQISVELENDFNIEHDFILTLKESETIDLFIKKGGVQVGK
jgi:hypothetical protein